MSDENGMHTCFEKMKSHYNSTAPFERPVVFDEETHDMKALSWHARGGTPETKVRLFRIEYCPFCGEELAEGGGGPR